MSFFKDLLAAAKAGGRSMLQDAAVAGAIRDCLEKDVKKTVRLYRGWENTDRCQVELFVDIDERVDLADPQVVTNGWMTVEGQCIAICRHAQAYGVESKYYDLGTAMVEKEQLDDLEEAADAMGMNLPELVFIVDDYIARVSEEVGRQFTRDDLRIRANGDAGLFSLCYQQLPGGSLSLVGGQVVLVFVEG